MAALAIWCRAKHPTLAGRLPALVEACLTYHRGRGNLMADWYACCQTWIMRENQPRYGGPVLPPRPVPKEYHPPVPDEELVEMAHRRELARLTLVKK